MKHHLFGKIHRSVLLALLMFLISACDYFAELSKHEYTIKKYEISPSTVPADREYISTSHPTFSWSISPQAKSYDVRIKKVTSQSFGAFHDSFYDLTEPTLELTRELSPGWYEWSIDTYVKGEHEPIGTHTSSFACLLEGSWESFEAFSSEGNTGKRYWQTTGEGIVLSEESYDGFSSILFSSKHSGTSTLSTTVDLAKDTVLSFYVFGNDDNSTLRLYTDLSSTPILSITPIEDSWRSYEVCLYKNVKTLTWSHPNPDYNLQRQSWEYGPQLDAISLTEELDSLTPEFSSLNIPGVSQVTNIVRLNKKTILEETAQSDDGTLISITNDYPAKDHGLSVHLEILQPGILSYRIFNSHYASNHSFYIDDIMRYERSIHDWTDYEFYLSPGSHHLSWLFDLYRDSYAYLDSVTFTQETDFESEFSQIRNDPAVTINHVTRTGAYPPYLNSNKSRSEGSGIVFGKGGSTEPRSFELDIHTSQSGELTFFYQEKSSYNHFKVSLNDATLFNRETYARKEWKSYTFQIPAGSHILKWELIPYAKSIMDLIWIDDITFTPDP